MESQTQDRTLDDIVRDLSKEVDPQYLKTRRQSGDDLTYIPWYYAADLLDRYAPGWSDEVTRIESHPEVTNKNNAAGYLLLAVKITIVDSSGTTMSRENTGVEDLIGTGYGDGFSNAYSMAFRRAAAMFGLGRYIYHKDDAETGGRSAPAGSNNVRPQASGAPASASSGRPPKGTVQFGKNRGELISAINADELKWVLDAALNSVDDPKKASFRASNQAFVDELLTEAANRGWK